MTLPVLCFAQVAVSTLTGLGGRGREERPPRALLPGWLLAEGEGHAGLTARRRPQAPGSILGGDAECRQPQ